MPPRSLNSLWSRIDVTRKWVLLSCAAVALSTVLPWYADLDAFGAGDLYLGVTGPLFLVGLLILASAIFTAAWILLPVFEKKLPSLPVSEGAVFVFLSVQNLVGLLIANSVFFHPKFGVNITLKETGFGMILAFVGALVMFWSSYNLMKKSTRPAFSVETQKGDRTARPMMSASMSSRPTVAVPPRPADHYSGSGLNPSGSLPRRTPIERDSASEDRPAPQPLRMDL